MQDRRSLGAFTGNPGGEAPEPVGFHCSSQNTVVPRAQGANHPRKSSQAKSDHQGPPVSAVPPRRIFGSRFRSTGSASTGSMARITFVSCPLATTVAQLQPVLHRKLLLNRETHRLYLRERGRGAQRLPVCTNLH